MQLTMDKVFKILAPAGSLRRRVALSLAVVRVILAPVLFLSVYYLIKMDSILDRVLNVDAPLGTLAQRASIEILQARRAERSYFLLHNPAYCKLTGHRLLMRREFCAKCKTSNRMSRPLLARSCRTSLCTSNSLRQLFPL